jgi:hypothetical protein
MSVGVSQLTSQNLRNPETSIRQCPRTYGMATSRAGETTEQRECRLEKDRTTPATSRQRETAQESRERLEENRIRMTETRQAVMRSNLIQEAFNYDRTYDYESHQTVMIGKMDVVCSHCQAKIFRGESPGMCCSNGKLQLFERRPHCPQSSTRLTCRLENSVFTITPYP